jgi:GMP synthase-like glutamine amidotransferase
MENLKYAHGDLLNNLTKTMKKIHCFQHVDFEPLGCIENWINEKGHQLTFTRFYLGEALPEMEQIDWLIIMGGPMNIYETEQYPWLEAERKFIKEAISKGKTVLGICLGSQFIAESLGCKVYKNTQKEIGWYPITKSVSGKMSAIFSHIPETTTVFHWHGETFDLPDGAEHIFSSEATQNQAFVYDKRVVALQCHWEITSDLLRGMIENCSSELIEAPFVMNKQKLQDNSPDFDTLNLIMYRVLDELSI